MRHALVAPEAHEPVAHGRHVHVHLAALRAGVCVQPQRAAVADLPAEVGIVDDGEVAAAAPSLALAAAAAAAAAAATAGGPEETSVPVACSLAQASPAPGASSGSGVEDMPPSHPGAAPQLPPRCPGWSA